jgi:phosphate starvation-inducible PhoH-like protein
MGWKAFKHQEEGIKFLMKNKKCILADDMGLGKVIANDVPVLTPDGWVPHGSLKKGDYVIGLNGKPTKVLETYPNPLKDYYNITFTDGTVVESCDEHLWAVQTNNHRKRGSGFKVKALKELLGDLTYGNHGNTKWFIPMVKPVEFNEREISIDPYLLGCLLGDGSISQRKIVLSTIDEELLNECSNRLPKDYFFDKIDKKDDYLLKQRITEHTIGTKHSVIKDLESYNLMGTKSDNKFIPEDYKYNTKNIRLEILQGLLDTDGYCSKQDGTIQFYSTSKQLSDDVKELVQSFGGVAKETNKIGKYKKPDGLIVECKKCYILTINLPEDIIPFKLHRKINNMKPDKKYLPYRGIKSIEFSRRTLGQCIRVESDDHLYVMDKYVVTQDRKSVV